MEKLCSHCNRKIKNNSKYCPLCGKQMIEDNTSSQTVSGGGKIAFYFKRYIYIQLIGLVFILVVGVIAAFFMHKEEINDGKVESAQLPLESFTTAKMASEEKVENDIIIKAQRILQQHMVQGKVLATSLRDHNQGFISIVIKDNQYVFALYDQMNNQVAVVPFAQQLLNFTQQKNAPVIFKMVIMEDRHDNDEKSGVWKGENHVLPIYALYKLDELGNVVPGVLTTGAGENPSHYQSYLNEKKNVDIANLFLTEMKVLQGNVKVNKVSLPSQ